MPLTDPPPRHRYRELQQEECRRLFVQTRVGRLILNRSNGPVVVVPVVYRAYDDVAAIDRALSVFERTIEPSCLLQCDGLLPQTGELWSLCAQGRLAQVEGSLLFTCSDFSGWAEPPAP